MQKVGRAEKYSYCPTNPYSILELQNPTFLNSTIYYFADLLIWNCKRLRRAFYLTKLKSELAQEVLQLKKNMMMYFP